MATVNNKIFCVFCNKDEIKERTIISNDYAWAFPTNMPIVPGHILICPKRCVSKFDDLTRREIDAIFELRSKLKLAFTQAFKAEGFNYAWNEGSIAGQTISHFHIHMLPRKRGDNGVFEYEPRQFLYRPGSREISPDNELNAVKNLIKETLESVDHSKRIH